MTQVIGVDWSGRAKGAAESIWLAYVRNGQLDELENGFDRTEAIAAVIERAKREQRTIAGFDFVFSFPRWYCAQNGWTTGIEVWRAMQERANDLLKDCEPPFWGRTGTRAQKQAAPYRETDTAVAGQAKASSRSPGRAQSERAPCAACRSS